MLFLLHPWSLSLRGGGGLINPDVSIPLGFLFALLQLSTQHRTQKMHLPTHPHHRRSDPRPDIQAPFFTSTSTSRLTCRCFPYHSLRRGTFSGPINIENRRGCLLFFVFLGRGTVKGIAATYSCENTTTFETDEKTETVKYEIEVEDSIT